MGQLEKKVAIVTGGGTGIGRSIALEFAREGASVVIAGRRIGYIEKVAAEIKAAGANVLPVTADVSVKEQVRQLVDATIKKFSRIDILVNNAGIPAPNYLITDFPEAEWDNVINVNLKSAFLCIQAVAPYMIQQKYGKIINLASIGGIRPPRGRLAAYCVSKAGVDMLTKCATMELTPYGINVNCIAPGAVETSIYRAGRTQAQIEEWLTAAKMSPSGRVGQPEDIAGLAVFLASDVSSFVCGATIAIDGGRNARMS